jgi:hypothetical protein
MKQMREIRSGGSFLSQNDLRMYFGLGDYSGPVDVDIRMPGGRRWAWTQLPSDRLHAWCCPTGRRSRSLLARDEDPARPRRSGGFC